MAHALSLEEDNVEVADVFLHERGINLLLLEQLAPLGPAVVELQRIPQALQATRAVLAVAEVVVVSQAVLPLRVLHHGKN